MKASEVAVLNGLLYTDTAIYGLIGPELITMRVIRCYLLQVFGVLSNWTPTFLLMVFIFLDPLLRLEVEILYTCVLSHSLLLHEPSYYVALLVHEVRKAALWLVVNSLNLLRCFSSLF